MSNHGGQPAEGAIPIAEASVEVPMRTLSIEPTTPGRDNPDSGESSMEVDDEGSMIQGQQRFGQQNPVRDQSFSFPTNAEEVRQFIIVQGELLKKRTQEKLVLTALSLANPGQESPESKARMDVVSRDMERIKVYIRTFEAVALDFSTANRAASTADQMQVVDNGSGQNGATQQGGKDEREVKINPDTPRYHGKVEPHLLPKVDPKTSGPVMTNVREFLHEFRQKGMLRYTSVKFQQIAFRLLSLANMDVKTSDAFAVAHANCPEVAKGKEWDWDKCERVFVDCALTTLEKAAEVDEFAQAGREKGESFKSYHNRLHRLIEVYKVKELPKHADVTQTLRMSVPSLTLTVMEIAEVQQQMLKYMGMLMPDVTTLDFLMKAIPQIHGPDDSPEWKTMIEAAKKMKNAKELEQQRQAQQAKDKTQKKPVTYAVNGSSDANTTPIEARSGQHSGGRGGFGNNGFRGHNKSWTRGGNRGGRGSPYHKNEGQGELIADDDDFQTVADSDNEGEVLKYCSLRHIPVQAETSPMLKPEDNSGGESDVVKEIEGIEVQNKTLGVEVLHMAEEQSTVTEALARKKKLAVKRKMKRKRQLEKKSAILGVQVHGKSPLAHPPDGEEGGGSEEVAASTMRRMKAKKRKKKKKKEVEKGLRPVPESTVTKDQQMSTASAINTSMIERTDSAPTLIKKQRAKRWSDGMDSLEEFLHDEDSLAYAKLTVHNDSLEDDGDVRYSGVPLYEFHDDVIGQIKHISSSKKSKTDNRLYIHVSLFNERCMALIDTGATHSFISETIVSKYSIPVEPKRGSIELANGSKIPRRGETENVEVTCGERVLCAPFEVIQQEHAITIGMDLFHRFGFNIVGLPDPEQSTAKAPPPVEDAKPTLIPLTTPPVEKTEEFVKEKRAFMREIDKALQANAKIPTTSHCIVPEMKVYLEVPEGVELFRRPRVFAASQIPILDDAVKTWLEDDVIMVAPAMNPYNNTLTLAAKKDAEGNKTLYRVCLDPRPLNALLPNDNFPVPLISDIMNFAGGNTVFSTIDLRQAYHRLPIHEEDRPLTAFMHGGIQYMFKKAPFGLKPLSSLFQRGMTRILGDLKFVRNFIDDILIASRNRKEHAEHVRIVIERLTAAKLIINIDKCKFFSTQVALLGFVIDINGKRIDTNKLANIDEWKPPTTGKQVMSYMGTFNFFREYVPLISTLSAPLDALRNKAGTFVLNELQLKCFDALKNLLVRAPILHFPRFDLPFYVATDASNYGIGAVLYQLVGPERDPENTRQLIGPEGHPKSTRQLIRPEGDPKSTRQLIGPEGDPKSIRYISFVARSLQPSERNYSATQRELLGIVFALRKLHYYLWGRHFTLYTDHRALTFMHTQKEMNSMLTAWQETILDYTFKVVYRPGVLNVLPDFLSRQFPQELWLDKIEGKAPTRIYGYIHLIRDKDTPQETVPVSGRNKLLVEAHAMGHVGANAMVRHIHSLNKTWPFLAKDCLDYVKRCSECQRVNIARKGYHPLSAIFAQLPGEHMAVDLAGPFPAQSDGNRFLLVLVDVCTRFVFLEPIPNKEALTVAKVLFKIFTTIGFPRILQSDNGREFVNRVTEVMTSQMGVQHRLVTPYHPRGNGVAENHVKTACNIIRKEFHDQRQAWARHVPMAQLAMNTRSVALHNSSPFSLFFARKFNGISNFSTEKKGVLLSQEELLERLEYMTKTVFPAIQSKTRETQRRMIERFNRTVLHNEFPDGAKVMTLDPIKGDKLAPRYEGPYTVVRRTTGGSYVVKDGTGEELGRNFAPSQLKLVLDDFESTEAYEVEKILDHREEPGEGVEYHVKWKGYKDTTWEPQRNFNERDCIKDYWKARGLPEIDSSTQPRQETKKRRSENEGQELSSDENDGADQTEQRPAIDKPNEVIKGSPTRKGGPRKQAGNPPVRPTSKPKSGRKITFAQSSSELRTARAVKRRRF